MPKARKISLAAVSGLLVLVVIALAITSSPTGSTTS
jgi:hypothetical protein